MMKCAMCEVKLDDELDVVYGLYEYNASDEIVFCSRFCRDMFISDLKFGEHRAWRKTHEGM